MLSSIFTTRNQPKNYFMRILIVILFLILVVPGCERDNRPSIPYVYVNLRLYPDSLDYIAIGGYRYFNGGVRGILVYRFGRDEFMVYERCCPYDPEKNGAFVSVDPSGSTCTDTVCKSSYILYDGSPFKGPSPYLLMSYRYSYDGDVLQIFN